MEKQETKKSVTEPAIVPMDKGDKNIIVYSNRLMDALERNDKKPDYSVIVDGSLVLIAYRLNGWHVSVRFKNDCITVQASTFKEDRNTFVKESKNTNAVIGYDDEPYFGTWWVEWTPRQTMQKISIDFDGGYE